MSIPRQILPLLLAPPALMALAETLARRNQPATPPAAPAATSRDTTTRPSTPATSQQRVSSPVLLETDTLRMTLQRDSGTALTTVQFIKNESDGTAVIECARAVGRDSVAAAFAVNVTVNGSACTETDPAKHPRIPAWSLTPVTLRWTAPAGAPPFVGHLVVSIRDTSSGRSYYVQRPLRMAPPLFTRGSPYAERLVLGTLIVALAVGFGAAFVPSTVTPPAEPPNWDPKTSWASNVSVAGGLLTALLTISLPEAPRYLARPAYAFLTALFIAITAIAPSLFAFVGRGSAKAVTLAAAIAVATAATLWGALGQLATAWSLFGELTPARVLPSGAAKTFQGLMVVVGVLLLVYAVRSVRAMAGGTPAAAAPRAGGARAPLAPAPHTLL